MKWLSDLRSGYRKTQRLIAERALQQGKRRFIWLQGVLFYSVLGLALGLLQVLKDRAQPLPQRWNFLFLLCSMLLFGLFGYLWANWKWKDYEQMCRR